MTPMVDLFSVLLIFLLLTASFRPAEVTPIETPNSVSEKQAPDNDIMTIMISKDSLVFLISITEKTHQPISGQNCLRKWENSIKSPLLPMN